MLIREEHTNSDACPCKRVACPRYGNCVSSWEYHHASARKPLTRCEKLARKEQCKAERQERKARKKEHGTYDFHFYNRT